MADIQKPVEVPTAAVEPVAVAVPETAPALEVPAVTQDTPVDVAAAPATEESKTEEPAAAEEVKEEAKPIEEGHLGYKAQGLSFPKNLLGSKEFFFFSSEAVEAKALETYKKAQKSAEGALDNISWAAHTGKGLLFSGDKKAPHTVINLSHASEPEVDGNKFHFTAKGNKHTFKAANVAERDNWVAQIKAKIAEAKEIAVSVTESEAYKNTLESLKPAPKEEAKTAEPVVAEEATDAPKTEDAPKEDVEAAKEEPKTEEPKRRSASRKRASFFGFGKKDVLPKEETKTEETPAEAAAPVEAVAPVEATEANTEVAPAEEAVAPVEATEEPAAEAVKPTANKRNSFFGGVFSKKEKKAAEPKAVENEAAAEETEGAAETAPVIPPVDTTTPLAEEVIAADPVEAAAPVEPKTDVKEKRKSSLPFFGKRDASPSTGEAKTGAFSKLRATIKGKGATKAEEAKEEAAKSQETATETTTDAQPKTEETAADIHEQVIKAAEGEGEKKTEATAAAPAVTASA
ncbi:hypothetical protein LMH87_006128 [Akanthomyces muscarius]|uniref:PH domain-containing protein n=1 Tax=Akanthomyces muscarius TaxID=2231603 RepID=A0A9W8UPZ8_AKAMU|nr:hypothetical protein LMH87_006128 [Akanthomyces muscarius]KAJ4164452.1 hypothetical protein LMH87_006128 [Akanthomyces muscarius]